MKIIIYSGVFIFSVCLLILIHELGHFLAAKIFKIKVECFAIGFGKPLWHKTSKAGTDYKISPLLLGGYVKLQESSYQKTAVWKKIIVMLSGVTANLLLALLLFWLIFTIGITVPKPIIGSIIPNSIAAKADLQPNTEITNIDGKLITNWQEASISIIKRLGDKDYMTINNQQLSLTAWQIDILNPDPLLALGIIPYKPAKLDNWPAATLQHYKFPLFTALSKSSSQTFTLLHFNFIILGKLLVGKMPLYILGGPIAIFTIISQAWGQGVLVYMNFMALLSIMLVFMNLLPIPGLDGGNCLLLIVEAVLRKPLSDTVKINIWRIGATIILFLIVIAVINDIMRVLLHAYN